jgi:hypothetical protein
MRRIVPGVALSLRGTAVGVDPVAVGDIEAVQDAESLAENIGAGRQVNGPLWHIADDE